MARTNAQSNALKPKGKMAERIEAQKRKMEKQVSTSDETKTEFAPSTDVILSDVMNQKTPETESAPEKSTEKSKGGRPRNDVEKTRLVVYLDPSTAKNVKLYAIENESTYSDVVNAVLTRYLTKLDPALLKK